jgi:type IV pilus assembly protein PilB
MTDELNIEAHSIDHLTSRQAWFYRVMPYDARNGSLFLYSAGTIVSAQLTTELELLTGKKIFLQQLAGETVENLLGKYYPEDISDLREQNEFYHGDENDFLSHLITDARHLKSSDIHIETFENSCHVRIRIDGLLIKRYSLEKKQYPALINKIKIQAHLDIAEKRLPQDGRILFEFEHLKFDIRVSILPTLYGEKIVLRLLNNDATDIDIRTLGFSSFDLQNYLDGIKKPSGILLISGPTGSGKTTTLYATLKLLNRETRNILTIEDPIEYTLKGVNQVQLKESIGLTFPVALRTFLRQDPDIIMLGEIRDAETANMAIRASLTGHLVLSTIHTNSAWGIISRLIDMGIAPYLLANTLNTAVAQRLIRILCAECKVKNPMDQSLYPPRFNPIRKIEHHFTPKGCPTCYNTGYKGRKAVYEVIPIDRELSDKIKDADHNVVGSLRSKGIRSLSQNAFELFEMGQTSLEEIYSLLMN